VSQRGPICVVNPSHQYLQRLTFTPGQGASNQKGIYLGLGYDDLKSEMTVLA